MNGLHARHDDRLLWRVNQEEFSCRLRDDTCVAYIRERHSDAAAAVVAALLHRSQGPEQIPPQVHSHDAHPGPGVPCCWQDGLLSHELLCMWRPVS